MHRLPRPHAAAEKKLLPATGLKLCLLCHADPTKSKDGKAFAVAHPALDDGCASCHLPHVSDAPRLLKKPAAEVCADCHDPFPTEEGGKQLVRHSPVEEGECGGCHRVHGSDVETPRRPGEGALPELSRRPVGRARRRGLAHGPPGARRRLRLLSPAARRTRGRACSRRSRRRSATTATIRSRPPPPGRAGSIHRPVAEGTCARCHAPHGSAAKKLLRAAPGRELCLPATRTPRSSPAGRRLGGPAPRPRRRLPGLPPAARRRSAAPAGEAPARALRRVPRGQGPQRRRGRVGGAAPARRHRDVRLLPRRARRPGEGPAQEVPYEICQTCHTEVHLRHQVVELDPETGQPASGHSGCRRGSPSGRGTAGWRASAVTCRTARTIRRCGRADMATFCASCHPM